MLAIVPARGGSKRIPRKNIKEFLGSPILTVTLQSLKECGLFSKIYVSTDDSEISQIARESGVDVIIRDPGLSDDFATSAAVIEDAINKLGKLDEEELICMVYPITPLFKAEYLEKSMVMLEEENLDYVFTALKYPHPISRALKRNRYGFSEMTNEKNLKARTQDLEDSYHDAGMFYLGRVATWQAGKPVLSGNCKFIELKRTETIDVDSEEDWKLLELMYKIQHNL